MNITMRVPIPGTLRNSGASWYYVRNGTTWVKKLDALANVPELVSSILLLFSTVKSAQRHTGEFFGIDEYKTKGNPTPKRPDVFQSVPIIRSNNNPFLTQVRNGNIVVSDYQIGQLHWTFTNGGVKIPDGAVFTRSSDLRSLNTIHGLYSLKTILGTQALLINENLAVSGAVAYDVQPVKSDDTIQPSFSIPETGWLLNQLSTDTGLITETLGEANRKSVDVLTALAEAPESIKSALSGCTQILKMYREAKRGEFRLADKAKRLRLEYDESLRDLSRSLRNEVLSKRRYDLRRAQLKENLKLNLKQTADALASVWLNFRYNIMPNVYLIEGINESINTRKNVFFEFTNTSIRDARLLDGFKGSVRIKDKAFIKRKFKNGEIYNSLSANPFLTAWELIPLSFVIDWVINIGSLLSTLVNPPEASLLQEGSTYSWKCSGAMVKNFDDGSTVTCEVRVYKRSVINPGDLCGLVINPDFSPVRQLDALALSWNIALKKLYRK